MRARRQKCTHKLMIENRRENKINYSEQIDFFSDFDSDTDGRIQSSDVKRF